MQSYRVNWNVNLHGDSFNFYYLFNKGSISLNINLIITILFFIIWLNFSFFLEKLYYFIVEHKKSIEVNLLSLGENKSKEICVYELVLNYISFMRYNFVFNEMYLCDVLLICVSTGFSICIIIRLIRMFYLFIYFERTW